MKILNFKILCFLSPFLITVKESFLCLILCFALLDCFAILCLLPFFFVGTFHWHRKCDVQGAEKVVPLCDYCCISVPYVVRRNFAQNLPETCPRGRVLFLPPVHRSHCFPFTTPPPSLSSLSLPFLGAALVLGGAGANSRPAVGETRQDMRGRGTTHVSSFCSAVGGLDSIRHRLLRRRTLLS